jgi:hypothetical protein
MRKVYNVDVLLREYESATVAGPGELITLQGIDGLDGYNPSNPVTDADGSLVYVRVEPRDVDLTSVATPFRPLNNDRWVVDVALPALPLEDPCITVVDETFVVGGVRVTARTDGSAVWRQSFLRGKSLSDLTPFAESPEYMKDVRLIEYDDGKIGIFTRPWGTPSDRAQIAYTEIDRIDDLTSDVMEDAPRLETQPINGQWWGANAVYNLGSGQVGVLGHIAKISELARHYYAVTFVFDRGRREIVRGPRIIAARSSFPKGPARAPDLEDVVFPSWLDRNAGLLYCGLSDTRIGVVALDDPFE